MASLEICCYNVNSAITAYEAGAHRIELCKEKELDGTTPSVETFKAVKKAVKIPIHVMIRPRGGGFAYASFEMLQMEHSIKAFNHEGADGYVFGCLRENEVDKTSCARLIKAADGRPCTFHKAFDEIKGDASKILGQLQLIIDLEFKALLTSGLKPTAMKGRKMLHELVWQCESKKRENPPLPSLHIIVGGGVRTGNLAKLVGAVQGHWYHSSAALDGGELLNKNEVKTMRNLLDNYQPVLVDSEQDLHN